MSLQASDMIIMAGDIERRTRSLCNQFLAWESGADPDPPPLAIRSLVFLAVRRALRVLAGIPEDPKMLFVFMVEDMVERAEAGTDIDTALREELEELGKVEPSLCESILSDSRCGEALRRAVRARWGLARHQSDWLADVAEASTLAGEPATADAVRLAIQRSSSK